MKRKKATVLPSGVMAGKRTPSNPALGDVIFFFSPVSRDTRKMLNVPGSCGEFQSDTASHSPSGDQFINSENGREFTRSANGRDKVVILRSAPPSGEIR